jgi:hypothetical protein
MDPVDVALPATRQPAPPSKGPGAVRRFGGWRILVAVVILGFAAFWIWALFFASKEVVNRIGDRAWAERAENLCTEANQARETLADYRVVDAANPAMLAERGDLIDRVTDVVERMLDDVVAVPPADDKGRAIVPLWEADYRTYLADRRRFADQLRAGHNDPFRETALEGIPISDKLEVFAGDNDMPACAPPHDLSS